MSFSIAANLPLLEVLIPTYNRPQQAIRAIASVLAAKDDRVMVRCHSNGYESTLENFCANNSQVAYGYFETNHGPEKNAHKLITEASGIFSLWLSDEDWLVPEKLTEFLDFLEAIHKECNVVSCALYEIEKKSYYYNLGSELHRQYCTLAGYTILSSSTYMSGYVWRTETAQSLNLTHLIGAEQPQSQKGAHNVYSQIDISQRLLLDGVGCFYMDLFVVKGRDAGIGGHAHALSERPETQPSATENLDLNIKVYGPYARTRQFFYRELLLKEIKNNFPALSYFYAEAMLYTFCFERLMFSPEVVRIPESTNLQVEAEAAIADARIAKHISGSNLSRLFDDAIHKSADEAVVAYDAMRRQKENIEPGRIKKQLLAAM